MYILIKNKVKGLTYGYPCCVTQEYFFFDTSYLWYVEECASNLKEWIAARNNIITFSYPKSISRYQLLNLIEHRSKEIRQFKEWICLHTTCVYKSQCYKSIFFVAEGGGGETEEAPKADAEPGTYKENHLGIESLKFSIVWCFFFLAEVYYLMTNA